MNDLEQFIEQVHNQPYQLFGNNCVDKHVQIINKARDLGHDASLITCFAILPKIPIVGLPLVGPHFYAEVDGTIVDVTFQPSVEQEYVRNDEIVKLLPVNLSALRPMLPWEGPPLPVGIFSEWPWVKK